MTENPGPPKQTRILTGVLVALALAAIAAAAFAVVWIVVLDATLDPELVPDRVGDDAQQAQVEPTPAHVVGTVTPQQEETASGRTQPPQQDILIVPQEIKLIDIIPSPRIVTLNGPGQSQRLTVQGFYSDGTTGDLVFEPGEEFFFASSDTSVVEVAPNGVVSSLKAGGADVLVAYRNLEAEVPVLVWGEVRQIPPIDPDRLLTIDEDGTAIVLNRVMVRLRPGYGPEDAARVAESVGGEVIFKFRTFPGYIVGIGARGEVELNAAIETLLADSRVSAAFPDVLVSAAQTPPDVESLVNRIHADAYITAGLADAWKLMNLTPSVKPVIVFVVDTEFPHSLPDNNTAAEVISREFGSAYVQFVDAVDLEEAPTPKLEEGNIHVLDLVDGLGNTQHGTAVVSILAAANNSPAVTGGFSGILSSVHRLKYEIVFLSVGEENALDKDIITTAFSLINMLEHLKPYENQIAVVNLSFAIDCNKRRSLDCFRTDNPIEDVIDTTKSGLVWEMVRLIGGMDSITFVVSAGNVNPEAEIQDGRISYKKTVPALFSKYLSNVITVGGTIGAKWSGGSNFGEEVTIGAPYTVLAVDIDPEKPEKKNPCEKKKSGYDGYSDCQGTSFSAPLVSGTVALIKSLDPDKSPELIKRLLTSSAGRWDSACALGPTPTPYPTTRNPSNPRLLRPTPAPRYQIASCSTKDDQLPHLDAASAIQTLLRISAEIAWLGPSNIQRTLPVAGLR